MREGFGKLFDRNGNLRYEGEFNKDKKSGVGKECKENGEM